MGSNQTKDIEGDVAISRHAAIGGDAKVRGSATVDHNLRVEGWLDAPNVKGAQKGVFLSEASLQEAYPRPEAGWWALVGDTIPGMLYVACRDEQGAVVWKSTGKKAGELKIDSSTLKEVTDALSERIVGLEGKTVKELRVANANNVSFGIRAVLSDGTLTKPCLLANPQDGNAGILTYDDYLLLRHWAVTLSKAGGKAFIPAKLGDDGKIAGENLPMEEIFRALAKPSDFSEGGFAELDETGKLPWGDIPVEALLEWLTQPQSNHDGFAQLDETGRVMERQIPLDYLKESLDFAPSGITDDVKDLKEGVDSIFISLGIDPKDPQFSPVVETLRNHQEYLDMLAKVLELKASGADVTGAKGELSRRLDALTDFLGAGMDRSVWHGIEPTTSDIKESAEALYDALPLTGFDKMTSPDGYVFRRFRCRPKSKPDMYDCIRYTLSGSTGLLRPKAVELQLANDGWGDGRWDFYLYVGGHAVYSVTGIEPPRLDRDSDFSPLRFEIPDDVLPEGNVERDSLELNVRYYSRNYQGLDRGFAVGRVALYYETENDISFELNKISELDLAVDELRKAIKDIVAGAMPSISAEELEALFDKA